MQPTQRSSGFVFQAQPPFPPPLVRQSAGTTVQQAAVAGLQPYQPQPSSRTFTFSATTAAAKRAAEEVNMSQEGQARCIETIRKRKEPASPDAKSTESKDEAGDKPIEKKARPASALQAKEVETAEDAVQEALAYVPSISRNYLKQHLTAIFENIASKFHLNILLDSFKKLQKECSYAKDHIEYAAPFIGRLPTAGQRIAYLKALSPEYISPSLLDRVARPLAQLLSDLNEQSLCSCPQILKTVKLIPKDQRSFVIAIASDYAEGLFREHQRAALLASISLLPFKQRRESSKPLAELLQYIENEAEGDIIISAIGSLPEASRSSFLHSVLPLMPFPSTASNQVLPAVKLFEQLAGCYRENLSFKVIVQALELTPIKSRVDRVQGFFIKNTLHSSCRPCGYKLRLML